MLSEAMELGHAQRYAKPSEFARYHIGRRERLRARFYDLWVAWPSAEIAELISMFMTLILWPQYDFDATVLLVAVH